MVAPAICGCGRSPTGFCIGWHNLTEDQFLEKLNQYESQLAAETTTAQDQDLNKE